MRKLLVIVNALLKTGQSWNPTNRVVTLDASLADPVLPQP